MQDWEHFLGGWRVRIGSIPLRFFSCSEDNPTNKPCLGTEENLSVPNNFIGCIDACSYNSLAAIGDDVAEPSVCVIRILEMRWLFPILACFHVHGLVKNRYWMNFAHPSWWLGLHFHQFGNVRTGGFYIASISLLIVTDRRTWFLELAFGLETNETCLSCAHALHSALFNTLVDVVSQGQIPRPFKSLVS